MSKTLFKPGRVQNCDYIADRTSCLGNPYKMHTEADRASVCRLFTKYFEDRIRTNDSVILNELRKIKKLSIGKEYFILGCHCSPRECHTETIAYFLNNYFDSF